MGTSLGRAGGGAGAFACAAELIHRAVAAIRYKTATAVACERAFLGELDGSCRTPIAGLAEIADGLLRFRGLVLNPEGTEWHEIERSGAPEDAVSIGASSGRELLALAGPNFLASLTAR